MLEVREVEQVAVSISGLSMGQNGGMVSELRGFFDWCLCQTHWVSLLAIFIHFSQTKNEALRWPSRACRSKLCPPSGKFARLSQQSWKSHSS